MTAAAAQMTHLKPYQIMISGMSHLHTARAFHRGNASVWLTEIRVWFVSDIVVVRHPVSACVPVNYKVTLSVRAEGTGALHYQWFTDDLQEVQYVGSCVRAPHRDEQRTSFTPFE